MDYSYIGYTETNRVVKGAISAPSRETANHVLERRGLRILSIKPARPFMPDWERLFPSLFRVKTKTIILFFRELALLLESGTNIVSAFELLQTQVANPVFKRVLGEIASDLRKGTRFSVALAKYPRIFPQLFCRSLSAGEQTGGMEQMLRQIAEYMEKDAKARKALKSAMTYPFLVSIVAVIVVIILVNFVLPTFAGLYNTMGVELPLPTRMLLGVTGFLRRSGLFLILFVLFVIMTIVMYVKTSPGRYQWDKMALTLPLIGRINQLNELSSCCRTMAMLFRSGLPLVDIMGAVIEGSGSQVIAKALRNVQKAMLKGEGLSHPMSENEVFLPMMVEMVRVGEETGTLESTLVTVAETYDVEAEDSTESLLAFIQPAITIAIGVAVAFITISMLSAMYAFYGQMN